MKNIFKSIKNEIERKREEIRSKNWQTFVTKKAREYALKANNKAVTLFPLTLARNDFCALKKLGEFDDLNRPKNKELRTYMGEVA